MRKQFSFYVLIVLLLTALVLPGAAQSQTSLTDRQQFQTQYDDAYKVLSQRMLELPPGFVAYGTKFDGKISSQADLDKALAELAEAAGARLLDKKQSQDWQARRQSAYVGLGLSLEDHYLIGKDGLLVSAVIAESTAEDDGLKADDWILAVDGKSISGLTDRQVVEMITGDVDTFVVLTVQRTDGQHQIKVKRDIDGKIGVEVENDKPFKVLKLRWVRDDGPATKAGLQDDQLVTFIAGKSTEDMSVDDAVKLLRLPFVGDTVDVTIIGENGEPNTVTLTTDFIPSWDLALSLSAQYGGNDLYYNNFTLGIKSFDYERLSTQTNSFATHSLKHNDGGIIDMVGATGENSEVAATFLATFFDGETELLRLKERVDGQEQVVVYKLNKDRDIVVERGGIETKLELPEKPAYYGGKLVVVIDSQTSGVAEAVALTLQQTGRASLVGDDTAGNANLKTRVDLTSTQVLEFDSGQLLKSDGSHFSSVNSDRSFFVGEKQLETARKELAGKDWYNSFDNVIMLVLIGIVGLMLIIFARSSIVASRRQADAERIAAENATAVQEDAVENAEPEVAEETDASDEDAPEEPHSNGGESAKGKRSNAGFWISFIALLMVAAVAITVVSRLPTGTEDATNGKITVEFFTDGSVIADKQQLIIDQLAGEYSGDIEFKTIEIANNPYAGKNDWKDVDKPVVVVTVAWFDDAGKRVSSHSSKRYLIPKRELVPLIERSAKNTYQKGLPELSIKRVKSTNP